MGIINSNLRFSEITYENNTAYQGKAAVYKHSGDLYVPAQYAAGRSIQIWKSTDSGTTWAEADAAHHPTTVADLVITGGGSHMISYASDRNGTVLYIAYIAADSTVAMNTFDMATDLWGTEHSGGPRYGNTPQAGLINDEGTFSLVYLQASDQLVLVYDLAVNISIDANNTLTAFQFVTLAGVWSSVLLGTVFNTASAGYKTRFLAATYGSDGGVHVFARGPVSHPFTVLHRTVNSDGTQGTVQSIGTFGTFPGANTQAGEGGVIGGSTLYFALTDTSPVPTSFIYLFSAPAGVNPSWTQETVYNPSSGQACLGSTVFLDSSSVLTVVFNINFSQDLWVTKKSGGVWSAPTSRVRMSDVDYSLNGFEWFGTIGAPESGHDYFIAGLGDGAVHPGDNNVPTATPDFIPGASAPEQFIIGDKGILSLEAFGDGTGVRGGSPDSCAPVPGGLPHPQAGCGPGDSTPPDTSSQCGFYQAF